MERYALLPDSGAWYKANLHCHSVLSDGKLTVEELKELYTQRGYSVIAFTDHDHYEHHKELTDEHFLALAAYEVEIDAPRICPGFYRVKTYHLNFYDTDPESNAEAKKVTRLPEQRYGDMEYINGFIKEMSQLGFLACYNHPYWSLQTYEDYKDLEGLWAMEIYNYGCEHDGLYGYNPQSYNEMLQQGKRLFCLATDDNHNAYPPEHPLCDSFGGYTMIRAKSLSYPDIIAALKTGNFYSTMGPEIHSLFIEGDVLHIETSPVEKIFVHMLGRNCYKELAPAGHTITKAAFPLTGKEEFIWVECRDNAGKFANSNVYAVGEDKKPL